MNKKCLKNKKINKRRHTSSKGNKSDQSSDYGFNKIKLVGSIKRRFTLPTDTFEPQTKNFVRPYFSVRFSDNRVKKLTNKSSFNYQQNKNQYTEIYKVKKVKKKKIKRKVLPSRSKKNDTKKTKFVFPRVELEVWNWGYPKIDPKNDEKKDDSLISKMRRKIRKKKENLKLRHVYRPRKSIIRPDTVNIEIYCH